eukprot:CAMPEP_0118939776 /NCGR_PEP_ID=MMETSP1169-20130426/29776_1 /TAXON_ID=36882 /ORGANISM="Pyramimonas obovata, Strain CCMP722" /LENGTH=67 /DNA_ID=CAMNT_0006884115 /DNA_START=82 /DNA_END=282 /DNA_ORIENTATION=-
MDEEHGNIIKQGDKERNMASAELSAELSSLAPVESESRTLQCVGVTESENKRKHIASSSGTKSARPK